MHTSNFRLIQIFLALATLLCASVAQANLAEQRKQFELAHRLASQGKVWTDQAKVLQGYPLLAWVEHAELMRTAHPETARVEAFVQRHEGTYLAADLRVLLAKRYAESQRWEDLLALDLGAAPDHETRCRLLTARMTRHDALKPEARSDTAALIEAAQALWLSPQSQPTVCDPIFAWLRAQNRLGNDLIWRRIELAAQQGQAVFLRQLAKGLAANDRNAVNHLADLLLDAVRQRRNAKKWPNDRAHRRALSFAVARIARRDDALAAGLWREFGTRFSFGAAANARMLDAIALYRANAYRADAADWLGLVPVGKDSVLTREWRVREALSRADYSAALAGLARMDETQQADPRWRYWQARALDETGQTQLATLAWRALASAPNFHGFLAADRLGLPYQVCPIEVAPVSTTDAIAHYPALERALEFRAIGWKRQANREWAHLLTRLDAEARREVVSVADQLAWFDRAPFALNAPVDLRLYSLRFALAHRALIDGAAKAQQLDPALVFGLIRSESAWVEDARSGADAYGLMQLLPSTAKRMAQLEGVSFVGTSALLDPPLNVRLGTRYLAEVGKRYGASPWLVAAAYNAGPGRVEQWLTLRGHLPADVFIETIPFKETREYVTRVLAFTQLYDWRLNGDMRPLSERLPAQGERYVAAPVPAARRAVQCAM
jgi:soluble lytic murein transglycosylase